MQLLNTARLFGGSTIHGLYAMCDYCIGSHFLTWLAMTGYLGESTV
jgi:hypothetical protein